MVDDDRNLAELKRLLRRLETITAPDMAAPAGTVLAPSGDGAAVLDATAAAPAVVPCSSDVCVATGPAGGPSQSTDTGTELAALDRPGSYRLRIKDTTVDIAIELGEGEVQVHLLESGRLVGLLSISPIDKRRPSRSQASRRTAKPRLGLITP